MVSLLGMALGVASLITVLSVMNGFSGELRDRILSLVPHLVVESSQGGLQGWQELAAQLDSIEGVVGVAPYIETRALLAGQHSVRGTVLTAIDPVAEDSVSDVEQHMRSGRFGALSERPYGIVLGSLQARVLGVGVGDSVEITVPRLTNTPPGHPVPVGPHPGARPGEPTGRGRRRAARLLRCRHGPGPAPVRGAW